MEFFILFIAIIPAALGLWHSGHGDQIKDARCAMEGPKMWFEGCDTCICSRGEALCSQRSCRNPYTRRRRRHLYDDDEDVEDFDDSVTGALRRQSYCRLGMTPGSKYKIECNHCICNDEGIEMCSMKNCEAAPIWADVRSTRSRRAMRRKRSRDNYDSMNHGVCAGKLPGDVITDGCHLCKCSHTGLVCSRNYCPSYGIWSR